MDVTDDGFTDKSSDYDYFEGIETFVLSKAADSYQSILGEHDFLIFGGGGSDTIAGMGSTMRGDAGEDLLQGFAGTRETFWLQRGKGADTVDDYTAREDTIRLDGDAFELGAKIGYGEFVLASDVDNATGSRPMLVFDYGINGLYYDEDGGGSKEAELLALFTNIESEPNSFDFEIV